MVSSINTVQLLQLITLDPELDERLAQRFDVVQGWDRPWQQALAAAPQARLVITSARSGFSAEMMAQLPHLQAICSWGVGYDTVDVAQAHQRGIVVSNTPDVLNECVADMAWALLLNATRRISAADRYVRSGQWLELGGFPLAPRVWGKKLGILGLGRIGEAIVKRAAGFGMDIRYTNRHAVEGAPQRFEPSLLALAQWADFLIVACRGGRQTYHLVNEEVLRALGPSGVVVNIARGTVIDQDALTRLLAEGAVGAAGLDVVEDEPGVPEALRRLDNVLITPHLGSATHDTRRAMRELVVDNAIRFLDTGRLVTPISAAELQSA